MEAFPAPEARRLVERFEWPLTPPSTAVGSTWPIRTGVLASQCLDRRIADKQILAHEVPHGSNHRKSTTPKQTAFKRQRPRTAEEDLSLSFE